MRAAGCGIVVRLASDELAGYPRFCTLIGVTLSAVLATVQELSNESGEPMTEHRHSAPLDGVLELTCTPMVSASFRSRISSPLLIRVLVRGVQHTSL